MKNVLNLHLSYCLLTLLFYCLLTQEQEQQRAIEKRRQQQQRTQGGLMSAIQTHPRSASRVKLLEQELALMKQERSKGGNRAAEVVLSKVPYWML